MESELAKTMMLITSTYEEHPTFKLIPISKKCPYNEIIFDPIERILAIVSKEKKNNLKFVPKMDEKGRQIIDTDELSIKERIVIETYYEYYIKDENEIRELLKLHATNENVFNCSLYLGVDTPAQM